MTPLSTESDLQTDASLRAGSLGAESAKPRLVIGVTSEQTCLVLRGRLRALRLAGFDVTLISGPGEALARLAEEEGIAACALPMRRGIAPLADLLSFLALCKILLRLRPAITDFSTPKRSEEHTSELQSQ